MASTPRTSGQLRVKVPRGEPQAVRIGPGASSLDVKEAVALAVGLPVGTFGLQRTVGGRVLSTTVDAGLTGDWDVVELPGELVLKSQRRLCSHLFVALPSVQAEQAGTFVSTELLVPVFWLPIAKWLRKSPTALFLFSFGCSIALLGLSNCPRLWVPALLGTGKLFNTRVCSSHPTLWCLSAVISLLALSTWDLAFSGLKRSIIPFAILVLALMAAVHVVMTEGWGWYSSLIGLLMPHCS